MSLANVAITKTEISISAVRLQSPFDLVEA